MALIMIRYVFFALLLAIIVGIAYLALVQPPAPTKEISRTLAANELPAAPAAPNPQIIPSNSNQAVDETPSAPMAAE